MGRRKPDVDPKYVEGIIVKLHPGASYWHQNSEWGGNGTIDDIFWDEDWGPDGEWWYGVGTKNGYHNTYPESDLLPIEMNKNSEAKILLSSKEW